MSSDAPSLLDLDDGFLALPRRLCASEFWASLRAEEKAVAVDVLIVARYAPGGAFWFAGQRIPLAIGAFIESEDELARRAGVSRKVVRSALRKMTAAGLISRRRAHPAGRCPYVTTVLDYERIRLDRDGAGPRTEQPPGQCGANSGPAAGQQGAPSEQGVTREPREQGKLSLVAEADASDDAGPFARVAEVWDRVCVPAGFAKARSTAQQRKAARARARESGWFEAFESACSYVAREPFYRGGSSSGWVMTLGWLLKPGKAQETAERAATKRATAGAAAAAAPKGGALPAMAPEAFKDEAGGF